MSENGEEKSSPRGRGWVRELRWLQWALLAIAVFVLHYVGFIDVSTYIQTMRWQLQLGWNIAALAVAIFLAAVVSRQLSIFGDNAIALVLSLGKSVRAWLRFSVPILSAALLVAAATAIPQWTAGRLLQHAEARIPKGVPAETGNPIRVLTSMIPSTNLFESSREALDPPAELIRQSEAMLRVLQQNPACLLKRFRREATWYWGEQRSWEVELPWQRFNDFAPIVQSAASALEASSPQRAVQIRANSERFQAWLSRMAQTQAPSPTSDSELFIPYLEKAKSAPYRARFYLERAGEALLACSDPAVLAQREFQTSLEWLGRFDQFSKYLKTHLGEILQLTGSEKPNRFVHKHRREKDAQELAMSLVELGLEQSSVVETFLTAMWEFGVAGGSTGWEIDRQARKDAERLRPLPPESLWANRSYRGFTRWTPGEPPPISADIGLLYVFGVIEGRNLETASAAEALFRAMTPLEAQEQETALKRTVEELPEVPSLGLYQDIPPTEIPYNRTSPKVQNVLHTQDALLVLAAVFFVWLVSGVCFRVEPATDQTADP